MCKKQTSISHSSTESEIISLDAGLRLDGLPDLELWDLIVSVLGNMTQTTERPGRPVIIDRSRRSQGKTNGLNNIDCVHPKRPVFASRSFVICVWGQRGSDEDDHQRQKSYNETRFSEPTELLLIGCSIELTWTQKSKSSTSTPKNNSQRHLNQKKFHMWWVESFVVLVQYQPFQFYSVLRYNGETISTRFRGRTSHSKIATNDESYCKGVARIILDFSKPGEKKLWKSRPLELNC